jgi:hypothetical protein
LFSTCGKTTRFPVRAEGCARSLIGTTRTRRVCGGHSHPARDTSSRYREHCRHWGHIRAASTCIRGSFAASIGTASGLLVSPPMAVRSIAIWDKTSPIQSNNDQVAFAWIITLRTSRGSRVEGERPVLRKTIIVLAAVAALTGTLRDDAVALATGHTGWDGLGDGGGHPLLSQKTPRRVVTPTSHRVRKWWFR